MNRFKDDIRLLEVALPWVEWALGFPVPNKGTPYVVLRPLTAELHNFDFFSVRLGELSVASVREDRYQDVKGIVDRLHPDLLFSEAGAYELSRVMHPLGTVVLLPTPCYFADKHTWAPTEDVRVFELTADELADVDWNVFTNCGNGQADTYFGIREAGRLVALASVRSRGDSIYSIGFDVVPDAQTRGLGTATMSAAGNRGIEHDGTLFATAAIWNIPSGRALRKSGMRYLYSTMYSQPGPFLVSPQPLGAPSPGQRLYNRYPRWAMNKNILDKEEINSSE